MAIKHRKNKVITFALDTTNEFACQISQWELSNNTDDPEKIYSYCPDGEDFEEVDPAWSLTLTFYSDWTEDGISDYLMLHDGENVTFQLDNHPDIVGEHVRWAGTLRLKAPSIGGEVRETETQEAEFQIIGKPVYSRPVPSEG
ncbi:hypothetical protein AD006_01175 [Pseudonocardia sp. EC080610-09]|uniref:hypothetical protein n=1 Tax=unclassified Pseudonocardia TaxID=2619320 RepID=UPI0006CB70FA|nr:MULTISPECIES: hypothetical protein [unclassified Pseudonocardia]ALE74934.1 hypothetical protein FRP1_21975 [Pseudonocardia sp. EC080625-04]ALL74278.1 hypothetical protein AD006_01175 [Pseudonocardia sp. EC080610-09]ALL81301.1 hypothetical protein AD017_09000 [Pseudonocardia sp. EC080619-01]